MVFVLNSEVSAELDIKEVCTERGVEIEVIVLLSRAVRSLQTEALDVALEES